VTRMCVLTIVVHNTALNSSDNLHSYPPDNHHSSDDVHQRGEGVPATLDFWFITWMGDHLWAGKPSWYVTNHIGQLSLPSLRGR